MPLQRRPYDGLSLFDLRVQTLRSLAPVPAPTCHISYRRRPHMPCRPSSTACLVSPHAISAIADGMSGPRVYVCRVLIRSLDERLWGPCRGIGVQWHVHTQVHTHVRYTLYCDYTTTYRLFDLRSSCSASRPRTASCVSRSVLPSAMRVCVLARAPVNALLCTMCIDMCSDV